MSALSAAASDWRQFLWNPSFLRIGDEILWTNYSPNPFDDPVSPEGLAKLRAAGQYSFLLSDSSALQLQYRFANNGENLLGARLAFYKQPVGFAEESEGPSPAKEQIVPLEEYSRPVEWIRLDFDPMAARPVIHPAAHFHVGGLTDARIAVCGVPTPRQFIEFIILTFYPEKFSARRVDPRGRLRPRDYSSRMNGWPLVDRPDEPLLLHFRVPVHR
jgi:hypothetical protein